MIVGVKVCGCRPYDGGAAHTGGPAYANLHMCGRSRSGFGYRGAQSIARCNSSLRRQGIDPVWLNTCPRRVGCPGYQYREPKLALSERRAPGAQPRRGFEGGADAKHRSFIEGAADDLHRQLQTRRREAGRDRHRRVAGDVELPVTLNGMVRTGRLDGLFGSISAKAGAGTKALAVISASELLEGLGGIDRRICYVR